MRGIELAMKALKPVALAAALCAGTYTAASALPLVFTLNPSATGDTTAGRFTADRFTLADFATIHVPANPAPTGSVTEFGFLEFSDFKLGTVPVSTVHTIGTGGYGIYEQFTATSHLNVACVPGPGLCGAFDTISVSTFLYNTKHGLASYSFPASNSFNPKIHLPTGAHPVLLATASGPLPTTVVPNLANIISGVPGASVGVTFTPESGERGFFVSPAFDIILQLSQAFTNTPGVVTTHGKACKTGGLPCTFVIAGGGGNGDFLAIKVPVPEPASLLLLGVGVGAIGLVRRRRA